MARSQVTKDKKPRKLTIKQRRFIEEYIANDGNGTKTALSVYDTEDENTAGVIAFENLRHPKIAQEIDSRWQTQQEIIKNAANKALNRIEYLVDNAKDQKVQFWASKDLADRAGHSPIQKSATISAKTIKIDL